MKIKLRKKNAVVNKKIFCIYNIKFIYKYIYYFYLLKI